MAEGNAQLVQAWLAAIKRRDAEELVALADPDVHYMPYLATLSGGEGAYRGHEGLRQYVRDLDDAWEWYEVSTDECRDLGDHVLFVGRLRAKGETSGLEVHEDITGIYAVRAGRIAAFDLFDTRAEALQAVGLRG